MGTCELKWLWKPWNDESFYWEILKVNMTGEWLGEFYKKHWWLGSDAIPFQFYKYPHNTWIWVRLSWKLMYFSMGSLWTSVIGVMLEAASVLVKWCEMTWNEVNVRPKPCAVPGLTAVFTGRPSSWGEVPILGYVNERLWLVVRALSAINQGQLPLTNYCNCCGTSVQPLQSLTYSNSRVRGHGQLERPYCFVIRTFPKMWMVTCDLNGKVTLTLNHNRVVGMTLMFPLELS